VAGKRASMTTQPQQRVRKNNESMWQTMRAAMKRARVVRVMVTTMRVACNKEGDGNGGKSDGDKGVMQQRGW
jgi:hypothetical protein